MTKGEPTLVRSTRANRPGLSRAEFEVTGVTIVSTPEQPRGQSPQQIAAQEAAGLVGDERAVGVAIGRDDGVEPALARPVTRQLLVFRAQRLGIDGDEAVAATERDGLCAQRSQDLADDVAPDRGMLVDADRHALQRATEEIDIAGAIRGERHRASWASR